MNNNDNKTKKKQPNELLLRRNERARSRTPITCAWNLIRIWIENGVCSIWSANAVVVDDLLQHLCGSDKIFSSFILHKCVCECVCECIQLPASIFITV